MPGVLCRSAKCVILALILVMILGQTKLLQRPTSAPAKLAARFRGFHALVSAILVSTGTNGGTVIAAQSTCGPPTYPCARTDFQVAQLPNPLPDVGGLSGAGTTIQDPDFGTEIVRVTDVDTDPGLKICAAQRTYCNTSFVTVGGGSASANAWNTDDTMFTVSSTLGATYVLGWDPVNLRVSRPFANSYPKTGGLAFPYSEVQWSRVNPKWIYVVENTKLVKYDLTDPTKAPVERVLFDFASAGCLPGGFVATWHSAMTVGAADQTFSIGFSNAGGQETGTYVAVYQAGSGCSLLNTRTGQVTGNWGETGTIAIPYRFTLHNINGSGDNSQVALGHNKCTSSVACPPYAYFWQSGTTNVQVCPKGSLCGGHWVTGFKHWINNDGDPVSGESHIRPYTNLTAITLITPMSAMAGVTAPFDQHLSWNNNTGDDVAPYYVTTVSFNKGGSPVFPFPAAWHDEGLIFPFDGSGVRREHHTFTSGRNQRFNATWAIGQISQTGRFGIFTSDWMNTLGCENGSAGPCTVGNNNGKGYRADVFVVELK